MLTRSYINKQIDEIGISQWCWTYRSIKFSVPRKQRSTKFPLFIMIIKTLRADWAIKVDVFLSHVSICFDFLQGTCKVFLLIFFSFLSLGFFIFLFLLPHCYFLRCCSLEIFVETAVMGGKGALIVLNRRDLHCTVRIRALASQIL